MGEKKKEKFSGQQLEEKGNKRKKELQKLGIFLGF
jgi:hypothetical protein